MIGLVVRARGVEVLLLLEKLAVVPVGRADRTSDV
jgi:hypothetical protein